MHNLGLVADTGLIIFDLLQVDGTLVCQVVEKIEILFSYFALLLVSKDQINPISDVLTYIIRLKLSPLGDNEFIGIFGPNRELYVVYPFLLLGQTEIMMLYV